MSSGAAEAVRHEGRDAKARSILLAMLAGLVVVVVLSAAVVGLLSWIGPGPEDSTGRETEVQPTTGEAAVLRFDDGRISPPEAASALLDDYGWVDRKEGVVRIPIEAAMGLLVERGWPDEMPEEAEP